MKDLEQFNKRISSNSHDDFYDKSLQKYVSENLDSDEFFEICKEYASILYNEMETIKNNKEIQFNKYEIKKLATKIINLFDKLNDVAPNSFFKTIHANMHSCTDELWIVKPVYHSKLEAAIINAMKIIEDTVDIEVTNEGSSLVYKIKRGQLIQKIETPHCRIGAITIDYNTFYDIKKYGICMESEIAKLLGVANYNYRFVDACGSEILNK